MNIQIDRNNEKQEVNKITVFLNDVEIEINVNKFGELVVNKQQYGEGESSLVIKPSMSNEIRIS